MNRLLRNEFAKHRRLHLAALAAMMVLGVLALTLLGVVTNPATNPDDWPIALAAISMALPLISPLPIAVIASRAVEVENAGQGWLLHATASASRGRLCTAKLLATGLIVAGTTVTAVLAVIVVMLLLGAGSPPAGTRWLWLGFGVSAVIVNLAVLAWQLMLSARVENQLTAIGVGVLGVVIALCASGFPTWSAHLLPWGYYSLIAAADFAGSRVALLTPSYPSVALAAVVTAGVFTSFVRRQNRLEV